MATSERELNKRIGRLEGDTATDVEAARALKLVDEDAEFRRACGEHEDTWNVVWDRVNVGSNEPVPMNRAEEKAYAVMWQALQGAINRVSEQEGISASRIRAQMDRERGG